MQVSAYSNSFRFRSFRTLHIQNLSNRCRHKYDQSISRIFQSNFWQVFAVWPNSVASPALFTGGNWCIAQRCLLTRSRIIEILSHFFLLIRWDGLPEKEINNVKQVELAKNGWHFTAWKIHLTKNSFKIIDTFLIKCVKTQKIDWSVAARIYKGPFQYIKLGNLKMFRSLQRPQFTRITQICKKTTVHIARKIVNL